MEILNKLKAKKLEAIKSHDNKALSEVNAKIYAIRDKARKEREKARAEALADAMAKKFDEEIQRGL